VAPGATVSGLTLTQEILPDQAPATSYLKYGDCMDIPHVSLKHSVAEADMAHSDESFLAVANQLISIGQAFYDRGWVFGTSGNLSAVLSRDPLRLLITASGAHKGTMTLESFVQIDERCELLAGQQRPSAESLIHLAIISEYGAAAVLHTHSVWATILSKRLATSGGLTISGYEMLKGLSDVRTHEHEEWVPILENSQDYSVLSNLVSQTLKRNRKIHGILLSGHGLYTWGKDIEEAKRHVEILEFLFEVAGQQHHATIDIQEA
jgi:methylthioribulose-1-phosphate dehydratase